MRFFNIRRAVPMAVMALVVGGLAGSARAQYPYGYGYGYGPGYNVPVTPGFGAIYAGSTFGSYGYGLNRAYTTFGVAQAVTPRVQVYPATLPPGVAPPRSSAGYRVPGGVVRFPPVRPGLGGNLNGALPNAPLVPVADVVR